MESWCSAKLLFHVSGYPDIKADVINTLKYTVEPNRANKITHYTYRLNGRGISRGLCEEFCVLSDLFYSSFTERSIHLCYI